MKLNMSVADTWPFHQMFIPNLQDHSLSIAVCTFHFCYYVYFKHPRFTNSATSSLSIHSHVAKYRIRSKEPGADEATGVCEVQAGSSPQRQNVDSALMDMEPESTPCYKFFGTDQSEMITVNLD